MLQLLQHRKGEMLMSKEPFICFVAGLVTIKN